MHQAICDEQEPELLPVTGAESTSLDNPHAAACHFSEDLVGKAPSDLFAAVSGDATLPDESALPVEANP